MRNCPLWLPGAPEGNLGHAAIRLASARFSKTGRDNDTASGSAAESVGPRRLGFDDAHAHGRKLRESGARLMQTISDRYGEMPLGRRELDGAHFRCLISQRRRKNAMRWATNRIQPGGHHDELHRCSIYLGDDVDMVRQDGGRDGRFCRIARLYAAAWEA